MKRRAKLEIAIPILLRIVTTALICPCTLRDGCSSSTLILILLRVPLYNFRRRVQVVAILFDIVLLLLAWRTDDIFGAVTLGWL